MKVAGIQGRRRDFPKSGQLKDMGVCLSSGSFPASSGSEQTQDHIVASEQSLLLCRPSHSMYKPRFTLNQP